MNYTFTDVFNKMFKKLKNRELVNYMITWYNVGTKYISDEDIDDLIHVAINDTSYSHCKMCNDDGYEASPFNWNAYQGANQSEDFHVKYIMIAGKEVEVCENCYHELMKLTED